MGKTFWGILLLILILLFITGIVYSVVGKYHYSRDIDAWIDRAQVAGDMEDIKEYLLQLKVNMEQKGMTHGHFCLIFVTPANDLELHFKTICRLIERIEELEVKKLDKSDTAYQVAMDDIRGVIRELQNPGAAYFCSRWWNVTVILFIVIVGIAIAVVAAKMISLSSDS